MAESHRVSRSAAKSDRSEGAKRGPIAPASPALAARAPAWASSHLSTPFGLAGVQRKVTIGPAGDAYEREADRVSAEVASGRSIAPSAISPIGALTSAPPVSVSQRAPAPDDKKKDEKPKAPAVQKAAAPDDKKKDEKPKTPAVQKAAASDDKKKDEKPKAPAVQKAAAPDDKKKDEKPKTPAVQKAAASDDKKKDEKPKAPAVQKAAAPDDKKKDEKPKAPAVQKAAASDDKKKDEKPKAPAVQKAAAPDDKKKDEKPKPASVQKAAPKEAPGTPKEKKKEDDKGVDEKLKSAPVQMAAAPEDKKKDEKPKTPAVQKAVRPEDRKEEKSDAVHRSASAAGVAPTPSMESAASRAVQSKGAGEPINSPTRSALESRMGVDLSGVRVHDDRAAHDTAAAINARAFTHGSDIWLGGGQSQSDTALMAHEATHVVQQAGGVHRMLVQRANGTTTAAPPAGGPAPSGAGGPAPATSDGIVDKAKKEIVIPTISLPLFKAGGRHKDKYQPPLEVNKEERDTDQINVWKTAVKADVEAKVDEKLATAQYVASPTNPGRKVYFMKSTSPAAHFFIFGEKAGIKSESLIPYWDPLGRERGLEVDHAKEFQLGGGDVSTNLELLDATANSSSGGAIRAEIQRRVNKAVEPYTKGAQKIWDQAPTIKELHKEGYTIKFTGVKPNLPTTGDPMIYWKLDDIKTGKHLDKLNVMTAAEIEQSGLRGSPTELVIFTSLRGGTPRRVAWPPGGGSAQHVSIKNFFPGFNLTEVLYTPAEADGAKVGLITGDVFDVEKSPIKKTPLTWELRKAPGVGYGGVINDTDIISQINKLKVEKLSPIEFTQARIDGARGLFAVGRVLPTVPLIRDVGIELVIDGPDVRLRKLFTPADFKFPGPIEVTTASLELSAGLITGLKISGEVGIKIPKLGTGRIGAGASTTEGFAIEGEFNFDSELFDPARVRVRYAQEKLSGEGEIGIKDGKVRGIKSAHLTVAVDGEKINATGSVKPNIPGVEQGDLTFAYDPATGIVIGGRLELKKDIPGIEGGSVAAELSKPPGEDKWKVKASGEATPKIPGVSSKLVVTYDDGAFDATVTAGYEKGMLKGSITVGATNRPVGEGGAPTGPPPDKGDKITVYGGGSVTLKIAPWLQATAAIKLLPNAEIEVTGKIGLPSVIDIFPEKKLDKNIFKIGIDIPIVGVAAAGQRIGIFANISGGLDLQAGIGPGQLQQVELSVTYNPAHEDQTKVTGDAKLHIPAMAGLRLFVRGSLGVGIPLVSASAGLEIGGRLGLEGALDAGVHVEWTPTKGLDLKAEASVFVEPKLKFDITGFVLVELDLLLTTIELYSKKWQLASFEYGSGLRLGMKFPIHYEEGKAFDVSLSDVQFEYPKIDPGELLEGLIKKIA